MRACVLVGDTFVSATDISVPALMHGRCHDMHAQSEQKVARVLAGGAAAGNRSWIAFACARAFCGGRLSDGKWGSALASTKGGSFGNARAFVYERYGAAGWDATRDLLTPPDRAELDSMLPVGWYPLSLYARLIRAIDDTH